MLTGSFDSIHHLRMILLRAYCSSMDGGIFDMSGFLCPIQGSTDLFDPARAERLPSVSRRLAPLLFLLIFGAF